MAEKHPPVKLEFDPVLGSKSAARSSQRLRRPKPQRLRAGELCPICQVERLDYDGLLNLSCPRCGIAVGGCFT